MLQTIKDFVVREEGIAIAEYVVLLGLVAAAAAGGILLFGQKLDSFFNATAGTVPTSADLSP